MIVQALQKVVQGQDLSREEARGVMEVLMSGEASDAQIAAFLTAMRMKGETPEELTGFVEVMREKVIAVPTQHAAAQGLS
ncbi:MAG: anthranilate phosphoribosyltransferase, partial [Candidatus Methylomirabilales bacterium]